MNELIKSISKKEWIFLALVIAGVILITAVPYLYGYFTAPPGTVYSGLHYLTPGDTNVFMSMIEQAKQGRITFLNLYTSEPQHEILTNPLWLTVGWLGKIFKMSNLLTLHVARSIWAAIFIFVIFLLLAYLFKDPQKRKWFLVFIIFASGLGVFFNPILFDVNNLYEHPTDTWVVESVTFLTLYHSPHLIASLTLLVLTFLLMLLAFEKDQIRYSLGAGIATFFLLWFHPFNGPTVYAVLGVYLLFIFWKNKKIIWSHVKHYLILCALPVPIVLYLFLTAQADWVTRQWEKQNILPSPSVWMYLIGYGLLLPLVVVGLWITFKKVNNKGIFIISWLLCSSLLIYVPVSFQRRMSEGLHVPIAILAGLGFLYLIKRINDKSKNNNIYIYGLIIGALVFLPLTNIQILGQDIWLYANKKTLPYYLTKTEIEAMNWLKQNVGRQQIIFSSYYMGNFIPAYTGRIVWIGHGPQTIDLLEKYEINDWFWQSDLEVQAKNDLLINNNIDYVYYGRKEKEKGDYNPATKKYLQEVYTNPDVQIYKLL
ncbi:MAG: hypothetical protein WCV50_06345 [Patescibacteria group bacterium]|jgi:hypothetical protein